MVARRDGREAKGMDGQGPDSRLIVLSGDHCDLVLESGLSKRPSMVDVVYALCKSDDIFDISEDGLSADAQVFARRGREREMSWLDLSVYITMSINKFE